MEPSEEREFIVIDDPMREKLRAPFPSYAYKQHESKSFLSTLQAMYVVERLNDVFGIGRWTIAEQTVLNDDGKYVLMSGQLQILDYDCEIPKQYGGHATSGTNKEPADGYKSAVTDILSKSASYLEIGIDMFKGNIPTPDGGQGSGNSQPQKPKATDGGGMTPDMIQEFIESVRYFKLYGRDKNEIYWNNVKYTLSKEQAEWCKKHQKFKPE